MGNDMCPHVARPTMPDIALSQARDSMFHAAL
jgi:hypothetical protein